MLYEILQNCSNLKRLEIKFYWEFNDSEDPEESDLPDLPPYILHNLISIKLSDDTMYPDFFKMSQWLLNSAPNLTHFFYQGTQLPDLSQNRSIKRLELEMPYHKPHLLKTNHIRKVNKVLDQVKDTVEFFSLWTEDDDFKTGIDLQIPKMKNLKVFENCMLDIFSCGDKKMKDICTARMPRLETLRIFTRKSSLAKSLRNVVKEKDLFRGIKNLEVTNLHSPRLISGLKIPFPNLERLSIHQLDEDASPLIPVEAYFKA